MAAVRDGSFMSRLRRPGKPDYSGMGPQYSYCPSKQVNNPAHVRYEGAHARSLMIRYYGSIHYGTGV